MHKCILDGQCSEDQDDLRYALITFVLHYTPHSGDKTLTKVIWVLRKPTIAVGVNRLIVVDLLYITWKNALMKTITIIYSQRVMGIEGDEDTCDYAAI